MMFDHHDIRVRKASAKLELHHAFRANRKGPCHRYTFDFPRFYARDSKG